MREPCSSFFGEPGEEIATSNRTQNATEDGNGKSRLPNAHGTNVGKRTYETPYSKASAGQHTIPVVTRVTRAPGKRDISPLA